MNTRLSETELAPLVSRMADGDREALATLFDATFSWVRGLCSRFLKDTTESEEVALEVFMQAWRRAADFDHERGRVETWLFIMARSRALDRARSRARVREMSTEDTSFPQVGESAPSPLQYQLEKEEADLVRAALERLPANQREVVELSFLSGLTHPQLAKKLDLPLGTIKTRVRLGLQRLRDALGDDHRLG